MGPGIAFSFTEILNVWSVNTPSDEPVSAICHQQHTSVYSSHFHLTLNANNNSSKSTALLVLGNCDYTAMKQFLSNNQLLPVFCCLLFF